MPPRQPDEIDDNALFAGVHAGTSVPHNTIFVTPHIKDYAQ
jgi:hypothetical protein